MANVAGLILAGGLSRRMGGREKAFLEVGGTPLLGRAADRLRPQVDELVLNANGDPTRFNSFGLPVVADVIDGHAGPLAGVLTGLEWLARNRPGIDRMATVPSDSPFFPDDLVRRLADAGTRLAVAASGGRLHPVFALWDVELAPRLRATLVEEGERRLGTVLMRFGATMVEWPATPEDPFFNVNTPDELATLRRRLS